MELNLPQGELLCKVKVVSRTKDVKGNSKYSNDLNPFLITLTCDVEFPDGKIKEYSDNVIPEDMFAQVDDNGHNV